jgi:peptidoglycan/LPS O-acetylase OafA/YrhL
MPGLDGVRAVAVAAVVVFHMDESWLPGGFLGVDVFFTLSGFLITSLLLAELDASGRVDFKRFYIRRARRLLPALYLVLVATSLAAMTIAQDAAARVREDATAAFFYVTNWWYVLHGQSYFEATGRPPMLQHLWSLAVEEQFYFVWPVLCWLLWKVGRTRGIRIGAVVGALGSTVAMAWIAVAQGMPEATDPSRVYFGSDTHAMTLLVGAFLATIWKAAKVNAVVTDRGRHAATALGAVSLLALLATFWFVGYDSPLLYRGES